LLVAGIAGLTLLVVDEALDAAPGAARLTYLLVLVVIAAVVYGAGLLFSRRPPSPYLGRITDIADVLAILALVPFACGVVGLYTAIQGLFASIGG
jgi:hypothetical protein